MPMLLPLSCCADRMDSWTTRSLAIYQLALGESTELNARVYCWASAVFPQMTVDRHGELGDRLGNQSREKPIDDIEQPTLAKAALWHDAWPSRFRGINTALKMANAIKIEIIRKSRLSQLKVDSNRADRKMTLNAWGSANAQTAT
jgi:hypothetical protein